jgi:cardiolipin synthase A/B
MAYVADLALVAIAILLFLVLFEPGLAYRVEAPDAPLDSEAYERVLAALVGAPHYQGNRVEVLTDAGAFYEAELAAVRQAERTINLEAYVFREGEVTERLLAALTERARVGVKVKLVLDAFGNLFTRKRIFRDLERAGGRVVWYMPIRWYTLKRFNNRTHRELLVIDGEVGFIGGAGFAPWWAGDRGRPPWRDTVVRVRGPLVLALQSAFAENWLEASGDILTGGEYFVASPPEPGGVAGLVVASSPSAGGSTRARVLFQTLLASARVSIDVSSPYFVPDRSTRRELVRAAERGVRVRIITPGEHSNHRQTRRVSRRLYGELLRGGVEVYEYQPAMNHRKVLVVDGLWCVVGSTNFDNRSFGLNDEVNLAAADARFAARLAEDFARDREESRPITYEAWRGRSLVEKALGTLGSVLTRQS